MRGVNPVSWAFIAIIRVYRLFLSPIFGRTCRFYPTCSHYGEEAIKKHGAFWGSLLALWRIFRCNPWGGSGIDFVPAHPREAFVRKQDGSFNCNKKE